MNFKYILNKGKEEKRKNVFRFFQKAMTEKFAQEIRGKKSSAREDKTKMRF